MMRLSGHSRSIITEARRRSEAVANTKVVKVIVLQPGENPPSQPVANDVVLYIVRLSVVKPDLSALDHE
jgi:hypothetical protein